MFKKRLTTLTAVLAMTSMFACSVSASSDPLPWGTDGGQETIEGSNEMVSPILEVELPGDLMFGINPLRLSTQDRTDPENENATVSSQIVTADYTVINRSNVGVIVSANTSVDAPDKTNTKVELKTLTEAVALRNADTNEMESASGEKAIWLAQLYPTQVTVTGTGDAAKVTLSVNDAGLDTPAIASVGADLDDSKTESAPANVSFRLDKLAANGNITSANASGFKFGGAVDPNAAFEDGNVTVKTVYTLKAVTDQMANDGYTVKSGFDATVVDPK